jgi:hypothetical protein
MNQNSIDVSNRVSYTDHVSTRTGTVIELNEEKTRARIKWDDKNLRTWIRIKALVKINP